VPWAGPTRLARLVRTGHIAPSPGSRCQLLVDVDETLLEQARAALGTSTIKATPSLVRDCHHVAWCRSPGNLAFARLGEAGPFAWS
jgi:hypothetical protein